MSDADKANAAREAYLANREAVATATKRKRRPSGWIILTAVLGATTVVLFIATVVSYYNSPQEFGPTDDTLPTLASIAFMAMIYSVVLPYLVEARSVGKRIRNLILAAIPAAILALLGIAVMISLGSLVADLIYNGTH